MSALTPADAALRHATELAAAHQEAAKGALSQVCAMSDLPADTAEQLTSVLRQHARVAVHFHPDRLVSGRTVAACLLESGMLQSQFESGISNGRLDTEPGGARDRWENALFGQAYEGALASLRPKYGALALLGHEQGPAPRFGSCYFLLKPGVTQRATFTYGDSHTSPACRGSWAAWDDILSEMLQEAFVREAVLGERLRPPAVVQRMRELLGAPLEAQWSQPAVRNLDAYVEAQVHGPLSLEDDVDAVICEPSFKGTAVGDDLAAFAARYGLALHWHSGSVLRVEDVPRDFRGPAMPSLAAEVAPGGLLTPALLGDAARREVERAASGSEEDTKRRDDALQQLKLLWHVLHRFGRPAA